MSFIKCLDFMQIRIGMATCQGNIIFLQVRGSVRELRVLVRVNSDSKVREKSGN